MRLRPRLPPVPVAGAEERAAPAPGQPQQRFYLFNHFYLPLPTSILAALGQGEGSRCYTG